MADFFGEHIYKTIIENVHDGLIIADPAGNIREMNPAAMRLHEFRSAEEMIRHLFQYQELFAMDDPEGRPLPFDQWPLSRALYGETFSNTVVKVRRLSTGTVWYGAFSGTPVRDKDGAFVLAIVTIHDITEQKREEEALLRSREEWVETFNAIPDLISIIDDKNRIVRVNKAMADRLGISPEQAVGLGCFECMHGCKEPPPSCPHTMLLKDGKGHKAETCEMKLKGDFIVSVTPLTDATGHIRGSVHVAHEITVRKRMEETLRKSENKLRTLKENLENTVLQRTEEIRDLAKALTLAEQRERRRLSLLMHEDLQQILCSTNLRIDMLKEDVRNLSEAQEDLSEVKRLTLKAIKTSKTLSADLDPPILANEGLDAALKWLAQHFFDQYGLQVTADISEPFREIEMERRILLVQLVRELLANVAKHADTHCATLSATRSDGSIVITVSDKGKGFEVGQVRTRHKPHEYFGLFGIDERLQLMGGRLEIESAIGKGTTAKLILTLPELKGA